MRAIIALVLGLLVGCYGPTGPERQNIRVVHKGPVSEHTILDAAHGNGRFVLVGLYGLVATSDDAESWTVRDGGFGDQVITGITFSEGWDHFVAATSDDRNNHRTIATSENGVHWTRVETDRPEPMREVSCRDRVCVAVGDEGAILRSTDLEIWRDVSFSGGGFRWVSIIHDGNGFVATGGREQIATSRYGHTWDVSRLGATPDMAPDCSLGTECNDIDDISFTGYVYVAVTHPDLAVWVSDDGLDSWEQRDTGLPTLDEPHRGLWVSHHTRGMSVVGGGGGKLAISRDEGETWGAVESGFRGHGIWAAASGGGRTLVAGEGGTVAILETEVEPW